MKNHQTLNLLPILALASLFIKICESSSLHPVLTGPDMAYLGSRVAFRCISPAASLPVTYQLVRDDGVLIHMTLQADHSASFFMKVTAASDGLYHCKATARGSTGVSNSIMLSVVTPASQTRVTSEPFPPVAYEGSRLILICDVKKGSHLSYTWFFNRKEVTSSNSNLFHLNGNKLVMERVTPEHAGNFSCIAWSTVQNTRRFSSSSEVQVTTKVYVSQPKISFSVFKEGGDYHANVTCGSSRGSPPVNFSLSLDDKEVGSVTVTESLVAWFTVNMVPGLDMGMARCHVKTEVQDLMSEPVTLEVVPVGGEVKVDVEYLYTAECKVAAATLRCQVSRGTFPYVSWLLNDSVLPSESLEDSHLQPILPHFSLVDQGRTLVLIELSPVESGYYRCRARDSYDDSGPWVESAAELVQVTDVCMTTMEVITITFCCFLLLLLVVCSACVLKMLDHKQVHPQIATANSDAPSLPELMSQSGGKITDMPLTDSDVMNETLEITV